MKKLTAFTLAAVWATAFIGAPAIAEQAATLAGQWKMSWNVEHFPNQSSPQIMNVLLVVEQGGTQLDGKAVVMLDADKAPPANQDSHPVKGSVDGKNISFTIPPHYESPDLKITFNGTVEGDAMSGTTSTGDHWTATRVHTGPGGRLLDGLKGMHGKKAHES